MGPSRYHGGRRNGLSYCIGSYKLERGKNKIELPEGNDTDRYIRLNKRRFMVYNNRVHEDKTLENRRDQLIKLPKDVRNVLVTTTIESNRVSCKVDLGGQEFDFEEKVTRPRVICLGSYPLESGRTYRRPEGSSYFLAEHNKIKFYPEGTKKEGLRKIPEGAIDVTVDITEHVAGNHRDYQFNWE